MPNSSIVSFKELQETKGVSDFLKNSACIRANSVLNKGRVKFWIASKRLRTVGVPAVVLMLLLWLGTFALAASPQLHRLLHRDAQSVNHHCLITQLQQHPLWVGFAPAVAPVTAPSLAMPVCRADFQAFPPADLRLSPSRAPPISVSSIPVAG